METLKVFTAFSGYDSQCMALDRLGINYELIGWSEIDKYAIQAHNAVYPQWSDRNYGDISKIDWSQVPDFDLFTYSFPCTDISIAGAQKGFEENSGTRSSLLWECRKAIIAKRPKYLLLENVKALIQKKNIPQFKKWLEELESYGYTNFWQVLNAKDYGVPQNRERVFVISIRERERYEFPKPFKLDKCMRDILEECVEEKHYLSEKRIKPNQDYCDRKQAEGGSGNIPKVLQIGNIYPDTENFKNRTSGRVYDKNGISPTLNTCSGGGYEPKIVVNKTICLNSKVNGKQPSIQDRIYDTCGVSTAITTSFLTNISEGSERIRKLTPRECFRLMGVSEENIDKIQSAGISNSQQYKLAGNSIVVDVLYHIFKKMFVDKESDHAELTLF